MEYEKNLELLDKEFEAESQKIVAAAKSSVNIVILWEISYFSIGY